MFGPLEGRNARKKKKRRSARQTACATETEQNQKTLEQVTERISQFRKWYHNRPNRIRVTALRDSERIVTEPDKTVSRLEKTFSVLDKSEKNLSRL